MTFVFIHNNPTILRILEVSAKELGVESISFKALEPAFDYIKKHKVDAIVTGMSYRYREDDPDSFEDNAGDILLNLLKSQKKEIPVKGISSDEEDNEEFNKGVNYPYYKGEIMEYFIWKNLEAFISSIKGHD